jgi:uncharacterized membrane protein
MTLNITVLSSELIYQSADFRLTGQPESESSPKIVTLSYSSFIGFVTYAGIGSYGHKDVSALIADWLAGKHEMSMPDVANLLQSRGTKLVVNAERSTRKPWDMTFVLAGFEDSKPIAYVVSNFQNAYGVEYALKPELKVTTRHLKKEQKAAVIVTGSGAKYVSMADRKALGNVAARFPYDSGRIRRRLEMIHEAARAAEKKRKPKDYSITSHCAVFSFRTDESGIYQIDESTEKIPIGFPHIVFGINTTQMALDALRADGIDTRQLRPGRGFFATLSSTRKPTPVAPPCRFTVAAPESAAGYKLTELTGGDCSLTQAIAISENGIIVGTSLAQGERSYDLPWIWRDNEAVFIQCNGSAHDVNSAGEVALSALGTDGKIHAGLYTSDKELLDLHDYFYPIPMFTAIGSMALAINENGLVGGSVEDRSAERGEGSLNIRAFYRESGKPPFAAIGPTALRSCRVVDVNQSGVLLVMASKELLSPSRSVLWNKEEDTWDYVGGQADAYVYPIAIADSGTVLGQAKNQLGQPVAAICRLGENWKRLGTEDGWAPVDINRSGDVVGRAKIDGTTRPWLYLSSGKLIMLPYAVSHNTSPHAMNNKGQIVGSAGSDHGHHAVSWEISDGIG